MQLTNRGQHNHPWQTVVKSFFVTKIKIKQKSSSILFCYCKLTITHLELRIRTRIKQPYEDSG